MKQPLILIVDDHAIMRTGLTFLLDKFIGKFEIIEAESISEVMPLLQAHPFTHLILDLQLQDGSIVEIFNELRNKYPQVNILIYTMSPEDIFGRRMIHLGANGFLSKLSSQEEVLNALRSFIDGKGYMSLHLKDAIEANKKLKTRVQKSPFEQLSTREIEVLMHLLKGKGVTEIAADLAVKPTTIATFKARLFDKLGVSNLIELQNLASIYSFQTN